jgi:hypothetical protein
MWKSEFKALKGAAALRGLPGRHVGTCGEALLRGLQ